MRTTQQRYAKSVNTLFKAAVPADELDRRLRILLHGKRRAPHVHGRQVTGWTMQAAMERNVGLPGVGAVLDIDALYAAVQWP